MVNVIRFVCFFLLLPVLGYSQQVEFTKSYSEEKVEKVLLDIAAFFKHDLFVHESYFGDKDVVSIDLEKENLRNALDLLLKDSNVSFSLNDNEILLSKFYTIYGHVMNAYDHEVLAYANVYEPNLQIGASTNMYGYFSLKLPYEKEQVTVSYTGFKSQVINTREIASPMTIFLQAEDFLDQVVIKPSSKGALFTVAGEKSNILTKDISSKLSTGGEPDINQYLYTQTGVSSGADGIGGLHVRGGNIDQNLILLDGVRVFQPNHAFGLFSIFNTSLLNSAKFTKYNFHPKYAGGVSSVLDMRLDEGSTKRWGGNGSVSTIASQVNLNGPIVKDKTSILISGRVSHINPIVTAVTSRRNSSDLQAEFNQYQFYDVNAKISHKIDDHNKIFLSYYGGADSFRSNVDFEFSDEEERIKDSIDFTLDYGNVVAALRWNYLFGTGFFSNTTLSYSQYKYRSRTFNDYLYKQRGTEWSDTYVDDLNFESSVSDISLRHDIEYFMNDKQFLSFGAYYHVNRFFPGTYDDYLLSEIISEEGVEKEVINNAYVSNQYNTRQIGLYYNYDYKLSKYFFLQAGFNYSYLGSTNMVTESFSGFHLIQGRLAIGSELSEKFDLALSLDKNQQPFHLLTGANIGLPNDTWVPSFGALSPQNNYQVNLALAFEPRESLSIKASLFYKYMDNLLRLADEATLPSLEDRSTEFWEEETLIGDGISRGIEFNASYRTERLRGSLAYTFSKYDRFFGDVAGDKPFPFVFDQNHNLAVDIRYNIATASYLYMQFQFSKGVRQSLYEAYDYSPFQSYNNNLYDDLPTERRGTINGYQLPDFHRLDVGVVLNFGSKQQHQIVVGLQNVYNRTNSYFAYYQIIDEDLRQDGDQEGIRNVRALPILPTLRYSYEF